MSDAREGIVRLDLPDGRSLPLTLTYERLDQFGHDWVIERLEALRNGKAGSNQALADLLSLFSSDLTVEEIMSSETAIYPLGPTTKAIWAAWNLAFHGPTGRPAEEGTANPRSRRPSLWRRLFGRR